MSQAEELLASLTEEVPAHNHAVDEADVYLVIDPVSRKIADSLTKKVVIMQFDHESKRFQFELPRYISGHDMSLCNRVYVHWNNIGTKTGNEEETVEENADLHEVTDLRIDPDNPDKVICSWLVKRNSTQLVGILSFLIQYECVDDEGNSLYEFHSDFYEDVEIRKGRKNNAAAVFEYSDILEQWYARLFGAGESAVHDISQTLSAAQQTAQQALTSHLKAIGQESATQQAAIADAGLKALQSIPPEYAEVYRMSEEAMRTKSDAIVLQAEGETISVTNASNDPLQSLRICGKTEQVKTTGKNLLDITVVDRNVGSATLTVNPDKSITLNGTVEANTSVVLGKFRHSGEFVVSTGISFDEMNASYLYMTLSDDTNIGWYGKEVPFTHDGTERSMILVVIAGTYSNVTFYPMIRYSSIADSTYEPYTGGKPSPNPEYPQDLESVENPTVMVRGKNILPETSVEFTRDLYMPLGFKYPTGRYTFSAVLTSTDTDADQSAVMFYDGSEWVDSVFMPRSENGERVSYSKLVEHDFDTIRFYAGRSYNLSEGDDCKLVDMQLEVGKDATEFEPYVGHVLQIQRTIPGIPVDEDGNFVDANGKQWVTDEIVYDYPNNKWQYVQRTMTITLDGSENWKIASGKYMYIKLEHNAIDKGTCNRGFCSHITYKYEYSGDGIFAIDNVLYLGERLTASLNNDASVWKSILAENNMTFTYILAKPIIHELTTEEVLAFKALRTNRPNTVIQNGVGAHMVVEYGADTEIFLRECQPKPTDEQVQGGIDDYLSRNPIQIPSDEHIRAVALALVGTPPNDGKTYFYSNKGWMEIADADNSEY